MRKLSAIWGAGLLLWAGLAIPGHAEEIARWNSTNSVPLAGTFAPTATHVNVTVSNLVTSPNLLRTGSGPAVNTFAAAGYSAANSNAAMVAGHYWETAIQANSGYAISYSEITYRFRRANSGPPWAQWAYSTDGVNFVWLSPAGSNTTSYVDKETPVSSVAALQNVTGKIWFRMYAWLGGTANTAWGVYGRDDVLIFSGTVGSSGPVYPAVTFNPSGNQSIAASNELALSVSITPSGSGMKSWTFLPSNYAGVATMSNSTFRFTPAVADVGNVYALAVVGSNSVGSTTGTVNVTVTAYVPPVPVISFSPAGPYEIMATYTQKLGIGVSPAGSGIASWTFLPSNYAGTATLVGTNFTFTSAQADGPASYTFSVVATNEFGSTTGTAEIAVSAYIPPPPPGAYFIDFESTAKPNYAATNVTIGGKVWELAESVIGNLAGDQRFDGWSLRMRYSTSLPCAMTSQEKLITNGVGAISLWYSSYGTNGNNDVTLSVDVSTNLTKGWIELDSFGTMGVTNLTYRSVDVYVSEPVYVRIQAKAGEGGDRASVDNITITDYAPPSVSPYDAFLLKYNVTPGDPGTAPADDLDDDTHSNTNEFIADTNPYDPAIHP